MGPENADRLPGLGSRESSSFSQIFAEIGLLLNSIPSLRAALPLRRTQ